MARTKGSKNKTKELTSTNLKSALWETLNNVKNNPKKVSPAVANAVASTSRELMRVVNTELRVYGQMGTKPTNNLLGW